MSLAPLPTTTYHLIQCECHCHLIVIIFYVSCSVYVSICHYWDLLLSSCVSPLVISLQRTWRRHRREMLLVRDNSTLGRTSLLPNLTRKRRMGRRSVHSAVLTSTPSWVLTPSSTGRCLQLCVYTCTHTYIMYIHHKETGTHTTYTAPRSFSLPERVPRSHPSHPHVPKLYQHRCGHPLHHPAIPLPHLTAGIRYRS